MPGPGCFLPHHFYPQINESLELTCYLFTLHQTPRPRAEDVWDILNLKIFTLNVSNLQLKEKKGRQMSYITSSLCILACSHPLCSSTILSALLVAVKTPEPDKVLM